MKIAIKAEPRTLQGTGASRRLRRTDKVPGILYGGGKDAQPIELDHKELFFKLKQEAFHASILEMEMGSEKAQVLLRDYQMHPFQQRVLHADFQRVAADRKIHMKVPLHFVNADVSPAVKLGGAIINGHSVEGKTIGGGICSTSTTLFNAALRAGLETGARANHYYYITRYPKGLDATVWEDGSAVQNMTFTNDTPYPILIRTYARPGIVRFTLYSVPTGRTVSISKPIVKNYIKGYTVVKYTKSLKPGHYLQSEYQADGQDVWVTVTVKDKTGHVISTKTYYSHYARMIGVIMKGVA